MKKFLSFALLALMSLVVGNVSAQTVTFEPADNDTVLSISTVKVGYAYQYDSSNKIVGGGIALANADNVGEAYIIEEGTNRHIATAVSCDDAGAVSTITFDSEITTPGTYIVMIPEHYFTLDTKGTPYLSDKMAVYYTIDPVVELTFDPANGDDVDTLDSLFVTGTSEGAAGEIDLVGGTSYDVNDASGSTVTTISYDSADTTDSLVVFTFGSAITDPGTYTIVIPDRTFEVDGTLYKDTVTLVYTIREKKALDYTPMSGYTGLLSSITALGDSLSLNNKVADDATIEITNASGTVVGYLDTAVDADGGMTFAIVDANGNAITLNVGSYTVTIPSKYFNIGSDAVNDEATLTYTVIDPKFTLETPPDDVEEEQISVGDEVIIKSDTEGFMSYVIIDDETGDTIVVGDFTRYDEYTGSGVEHMFQWKAEDETLLYEGHTYSFVITFMVDTLGNVIAEETMFQYTGLSPEPSKIKLVSIDPNPDYNIDWITDEDTTVTLTYDGLVKIDDDAAFIVDLSNASDRADTNGNIALKSIEADNANDDGYAKVWTLTVDADDVLYFNGGTIELSVTAADEGDAVVQDANGNNYMLFSYDVRIDTGMFTYDPAVLSTLEQIDTITVACDFVYSDAGALIGGGMGISYNVPESDIHIKNNNNGEIVATAVEAIENYGSDDPNDAEYYLVKSVSLVFETAAGTPLEDAGEYTVVIPTDYFLYDTAASTAGLNSPRLELVYGVKVVPTDIDGVDAETGSDTVVEVYNLAGQRIAAPVSGAVNVIKYADGTVKKVLVK